MYITYHAAVRFLERVFGYTTFDSKQIENARILLKRDLNQLQLRYDGRYVLPSFPEFLGVFKNRSLVTVLAKR